MSKIKTRIKRPPTRLAYAISLAFALCCLPSCNLTRQVTTSASSYQNGDTTTTIITKTIESYDATKKTL